MRTARILLVLTLASLAVRSAYSDDVAKLREGGQASVDSLHEQLAATPFEQRAKIEEQLDRVCAQRDCAASRLYWYTDIEEAKSAARRLKRPILGVHLLGRLDEEMSCANSRFFRTLLYSDDSISGVMRDQYVLFWHSVRPVPRVTIEMGDGRVIRQTITGNSVHYLLDENGEVLDALPGMVSPNAFRNQLAEWSVLHQSVRDAGVRGRPEVLRAHHDRGQTEIIEVTAAQPTAIDASTRAMSKMASERPILARLERPAKVAEAIRVTAVDLQPLSEWMAIGERNMNEVEFSPASLRLLQRKQFGTGAVEEAKVRQLIDNLRRTVAADTAMNEEKFHSRIHAWFANGEVIDLASLNERIYRELFLTPSDDPWLGLKVDTVFTGILDTPDIGL